MKRTIIIACLSLCSVGVMAQSLEKNIEQRLTGFFSAYKTLQANIGRCRLDKYEIDHQKKRITVYANDAFGYQPFTEENVNAIYRSMKQVLPGPVNYYDIQIITDGRPIEELIPNYEAKKKDKTRLYEHIDSRQDAWVENLSRPYRISRGLEGRHIALWQSHGRYYNNVKKEWSWQRPRLFGTSEDLFTQNFVVPYLIPMLENAGAIVFTPRERDWQRHEVIVDNDTKTAGSTYIEMNYRHYQWTSTGQPGFAQRHQTYSERMNPFHDGTARMIQSMGRADRAFAEWIPNIPEKGRYAVYVSYQSMPNSVSDAKYLVFHNGGVTEFKVNQKIGGGTWVYLGTFEFDKGANDYGMVALSNESNQRGVITADAVRFGGGMGNIAREGTTSGMPRYLEGARYNAQWSGMPYEVYSKSEGENDYNDDINARSLMTNYLSGGSVYNPNEHGLGVPFEMALALHTDAGYTNNDTVVGSLGIYTTNYQNKLLGSGISRYASRDLADMVLSGLKTDIEARFPISWTRRSMWDRNYSETRLPQVPSMILELLAHQNFADMQMGWNPEFQFIVGRSVYKSILKYLATMHDESYTVQPLPVTHFAIEEGARKNTFELRWKPTEDPLEPTADATGYVVYTRIGYGAFDNGTHVDHPYYTFKAEPGIVYSFKVTAVNKGGESFPSEILSAYKAQHSKGTVLIVNAFDKTSAPRIIKTPTEEGFDLIGDIGLPRGVTASFCGPQQRFDTTKRGLDSDDGLGASSGEWEGRLIAGNTFDYSFVHGKAIQAAGYYSFVSCSDETVESGTTNLRNYVLVDLLFGADDKGFSPILQERLSKYTERKGNIMVSGACIGSGMKNYVGSAQFMGKVLKYTSATTLRQYEENVVSDAKHDISISREPNDKYYALPMTECIIPIDGAFSTFAYKSNQYSAGIGYKGKYKTFVLGFPFENIPSVSDRANLMKSILTFIEKKK